MLDRLQQLKDELQKGQQEMARLDRQRLELRDTMLRISGAIQVLEELSVQQDSRQSERELVATRV
jgi:prefoldin subunit 5